jgi:L-seryl-tRNA(Ser) seleniumtransferase
MAEPVRLFPRLPSVERVVSSRPGAALSARYAREAVVEAVRAALEELRAAIKGGAEADDTALSADAVAGRAAAILARRARARIQPVINATGVILHTNLGRAWLSAPAAAAVGEAATRPLALEYDLGSGKRGERDDLVEEHLCALTGAEAATVVNNNAAAVLLVLNALAEGREVVVSRGELIEIGGSFRIPDIMAKSGAVLREVGTTNRTHRHDYERAMGPDTAMLLKVHTSNYRIVGFTSEVGLAELREVAATHGGVIVVEDLGAGALVDLARWGLPAEPVVADRLASGADLVTCSGDKLLGGPQCGIIAGRGELVERVRRDPLKRALRCDKMTLAALEATLRTYRFDPHPENVVPTLKALVRSIDELERIGAEAVTLIGSVLGERYSVALEPSEAQIGSGSQPTTTIVSRAVSIESPDHGPDAIAARFRAAPTPIIGRIENDRFLLDVRAVDHAADLVPDVS